VWQSRSCVTCNMDASSTNR